MARKKKKTEKNIKRITLKTSLKKVQKIFNISDIHIRNLKRHSEYREVFERLYQQIKEIGTENSIIFAGGDLSHSKNEMSPELIELLGNLIDSLSSLAPVILITGNHDTNLANPSRLDVISPIVKLMKNENVYYLKDSGIYDFADVTFVVMSVFDSPDSYILAKDFDAKTKIALYHGTLNNTKTEFGFTLSGMSHTKFAGYDFALLGDIHKKQILQTYYKDKEEVPPNKLQEYLKDGWRNENENIVYKVYPQLEYAGSLIQQHYGEDLEHGFLVWNVKEKTSMFHRVENDYAYITLDVENGNIPILTNIPKKPKIRVRIKNTKASEINQILSVIRKKYSPIELSTINLDPINFQDLNLTNDELIGNVRDVNLQNQLICEYLRKKHGLNDEILEEIKKINIEINNKLPKTEVIRNVRFKIKKLEFSNMFSYGEDNHIDFSNIQGIIGLMGTNSSGKSSLLSILLYTLFDKTERVFRGIDIMNSGKNDFYCKVNFSIENKDFFIERIGEKVHNKKRNLTKVKVSVNFWTINEFGEKESLNGEDRDKTNVKIREYVGIYEDFILTALSIQNQFSTFIDLKQSNRKDFLVSFLDIVIFNYLCDVANKEITWISDSLNEYEKNDYPTMISDLENKLDENKKVLKSLEKINNELKEKETNTNKTIRELTTKLIPIDMPKKSLSEMEKEKKKLLKSIESEQLSILENSEELLKYKKKFIEENNLLSTYDIEDIQKNCKIYDEYKLELHNKETKFEVLRTETKANLEKSKNLAKHKFDPNCKYCMDNILVKDAIASKQILKKNIENATILKSEIDVLKKNIDIYKKYGELENEIKLINDRINIIKDNSIKSKNKINYYEKNVILIKNDLDAIERDVIKYHKHIKDKEKNDVTNSLIDDQDKILSSVISQLNISNKKIIETTSTIKTEEVEKENILSDMEKVRDLEMKYEAYGYYLEAIDTNGVPYELVSRVIPSIQDEVNNILSQIVDFNIKLELDGKNVNTRIYYNDEQQWDLSAGGGMEKFIASIAMRVALINFSNLPRPNCLFIDEGFSNTDSDILNQLPILFDYLRSQFEFVMCISHNMLIKDMVDSAIIVSKIDGFSKMNYE